MSGWPAKETLQKIMEHHDMEKIQKLGGIEGIMKSLNTSENGISTHELKESERTEKYGTNEMAKAKVKSFLQQWLEAFLDTTLIILLVLAVISLIIAGAVEHMQDLSWLDGTAILVTVLIVTLVTAGNNWSQERQFQKLNERQKDRDILVIRDGVPTKISILKLLVGDIYVISTGDVLPADGLCIESHNIQSDESPMTGEPDLIRKAPDNNPFLLSGCKVQTGFGKMLVIAVGMNTQFGILKAAVLSATQERKMTPLQEKLDNLAKRIGYIGMASAAAVLILLLVFWIVEGAKDTSNWKTGRFYIKLVTYFTIAVSIIVMAVPEGLPLAVTIALAYSMSKMLKDNNLVRILSACETMGGATTICSDKTGTLTQNKMRVTHGFFLGKLMEVEQRDLPPTVNESSSNHEVEMSQYPELHSHFDDKYTAILKEAVAMNSSANIRVKENGLVDYLGNVTECALLRFCNEQGGETYESIRKRVNSVQTFPFSSDKKRMSVIAQHGDGYRIYTKGASEIVSGMCTRIITREDVAEPISEETRALIDKTILDMASNGLRTLAIAYRDIPADAVPAQQAPAEGEEAPEGPFAEAPEEDLILVAIAGIKDPLREEVKGAIQDCHDANIVVRMVTGDNIITAMHIAESCGIYDRQQGIAMEGPLFRSLTEEDRLKILPRLQVLARSSPIDKLTLVHGLKTLGHVVAVTGDGTNDAPALSESDVGFAMGITGTEVAKDASSIIITDDNFASIVKAVMWGRNVYDCIRKFIQFQLTVNVSAVTIAVFAAIFAITPLTAVQMLWVNLIMDTLAALALATETPTHKLLKRDPYGRHDSIICPSMWRNIIGGSIYEFLIVVLSLFLWGKSPHAGFKDPSTHVFGCTFDDDAYLKATISEKLYDSSKFQPVDASTLMWSKGLCRHFLLDQSVAVFSQGHFSFIFNTFIFMQMFNWITARKCYNELNFFDRIFNNWMFIFIWVIVLVFQFILMFVPGIRAAFGVPGLMSAQLWGYSILFSILMIPFKFILHLIKAPEPFNGAIPFVPVEGVPAGVYRHKQPFPEGCTLTPPVDEEDSSSSSSSSTAAPVAAAAANTEQAQPAEEKKEEAKEEEEKKEEETKEAEEAKEEENKAEASAPVEEQPKEEEEKAKEEETEKEEEKPKEEAPAEEQQETPKEEEKPEENNEEPKEEEKEEETKEEEPKQEEPAEEPKEEQPKQEEQSEGTPEQEPAQDASASE